MISSDLIREARLRAHLTQAELGRRTGRPGSMIGRWERGEARPPLETVAELVRAAGFELVVSLAPADEHDRVLIRRALLRSPAERLDEMVRSVRKVQAMAGAAAAGRG